MKISDSRHYPHFLMLAASVLWATLPVGVALTGGASSIAVNLVFFGMFGPVICAGYLRWAAPDLLKPASLKAGFRKTLEGSFVFQRCFVLFYMLGMAWASPEVAAVLMEAWAVWYVLVSVRWRENLSGSLRDLFWMSMAFAGAAATIVSQSSQLSGFTFLGVAAVLLAGLLGGANIKTTIEYGEDLSGRLGGGNREHWGVLCLGAASAVIGAAAVVVAGAQTLVGGGFLSVSPSEYVWLSILWLFPMPVSQILIRVCNSKRQEHQIGVNAIGYVSAPMAVGFLLAAGETTIVSHWWFWSGMAAVLAANGCLHLYGVFSSDRISNIHPNPENRYRD